VFIPSSLRATLVVETRRRREAQMADSLTLIIECERRSTCAESRLTMRIRHVI
jgi:hypothetical protein